MILIALHAVVSVARASARALVNTIKPSLTVGLLTLLALAACRNSDVPKPDSKEYRDLVSAFYVGLAGLQTGEDVRAKDKLTLATHIAPGEPASWANLGLLAVRQQEFDTAFEKVEKARSLAPDNSQIEALLGLIESKRGKLPEAITHLNKAIALDTKNLKALYALAQETERQATDTSDAEAQKLLEKIVSVQSDNLAVLLDVTRLAAKRGDGEALKKAVAKLAENSPNWPDEAKQQLTTLQQIAVSPNPRGAATQSAFLKNVLARVPAYRQSMNAVKTPAEFVGDPFLKFIKLPSPSSQPAPPDTAMTFSAEEIPGFGNEEYGWVGVISLDGENKPVVVAANNRKLKIQGGETLAFPGKDRSMVFRNSVLAADLNYDFKTDIVLAGDGGVKLYEQREGGRFKDVTASAKLPVEIVKKGYYGAWGFDVDQDGDLDIVLSGQDGKPVVLRNNGDGTFAVLNLFSEAGTILHFVTADIDGDGDLDVATVNARSKLNIFTNERLGVFRSRIVPKVSTEYASVVAVAAADIDSNGVSDFVYSNADMQVFQLSASNSSNEFQVKQIAGQKSSPIPSGEIREDYGPTFAELFISELDNNGSLEIVNFYTLISDIYLGTGNGNFEKMPNSVFPDRAWIYAIADVNNDGRSDFIGIDKQGKPTYFINHGTKNYHSQTIRTRAAHATGDQRINSFGIGGEIEIRSGLLTQKQVITSPSLHFGLGENTQTDVARIVWPNGAVQAEFELKADQSVLAEQRLKGSCPTLFAWDGKQMSFVKDCSPWNPALGLHINAQVVANVEQTEEWFKIPGSALVPKADASGSLYDLRITGELWEAFYIDQYSLMAVDHPPGTEVFTDERFTMPQPKPQLYVTKTPKPFASVKDDRGQDVAAIVSKLDQQYLDTFGRGQYQGVTRDHWVELELGEDAPRDNKLYLIGHGWLHPTDATINIAIGQGSTSPPQGLSLEVQDEKGNWVVAKPGLGFLSGKLKTMVIDLDGVFRPGLARKLRLRTNMEIYWDKLEWAEAASAEQVKIQRLDTASADLLYRGFSRFTQANLSSPELPDYNWLEGTAQKWRDLTGYYTRYGDVRELLAKTDDRMLIMNAGDELRLTFNSLPAPPAGWTRDFVMIGDGWTKDGDYNCTYAATVLPLPFHGIKDYNRASTRLEDNPAYKRFRQDWQVYHTRYVTPEWFQRALWEKEISATNEHK